MPSRGGSGWPATSASSTRSHTPATPLRPRFLLRCTGRAREGRMPPGDACAARRRRRWDAVGGDHHPQRGGSMTARPDGCALVTGGGAGSAPRSRTALAADGLPVGVTYREREDTRTRRRGRDRGGRRARPSRCAPTWPSSPTSRPRSTPLEERLRSRASWPSTTRGSPTTTCLRVCRDEAWSTGHRDQPHRRLSRDAPRHPEDAARALGPDRQRRLDRRHPRQCGPGQLRRVQGRPHRDDAQHRDRGRAPRA